METAAPLTDTAFRRRTLIISGVAALCAAGLTYFFMQAEDTLDPAAHWLLRLSCDLAWWVAGATLLFSGVRLARTFRLRWAPLGRIVGGVVLACIPLAMALMFLGATWLLREMDRNASEAVAANATRVWSDTTIDPKARAFVTRSHAANVWRDTGVKAEVLNDRGEKVLFEPTADEKAELEMERKVLHDMVHSDVVSKVTIAANLLVIAGAVGGAWLRTPRRKPEEGIA